MRDVRRGLIVVVAVVLTMLLTLPASTAHADSRTYGDIAVSVDPPLHGESSYGYASYRVVITNRSKQPHRIRIQIPATSFGYGGQDHLARMTRTVEVEPGAATAFEMLQPPVRLNGSGAAVYIDGARQRRDVNVNTAPHIGYNPGQLVMVSRDVAAGIKEKIDTAIEDDASSGSGSYGPYGGYRGGSIFELLRQPKPPAEWGTSWLGYTRYMAVMISQRDFATMPPAVSDALRSYVLTGGTLAVVYDSAEPPRLNDWTQEWPIIPGADSPESVRGFDYGLGRIQMMRASDANQLDSKGWIAQLNSWQALTTSRAATRGTEDANRDMPIVEGQVTPARGLLLVMFIFAVVIGPVNVLILWMAKKRMLLLVTVPVIALIFSAAVMVYALVSEGITPQSRTSAITLLDQRSHRAVTVGVSGYYAPLTPANGLLFDENTSVTPQIERYGYRYYGGGSGRSRTLDVTYGQHLASGWVAARVPAHFVLRKSERRNERLDIATDSDGAVSVVNGLGSDIRELVLVDPTGTRWTGENITAGQSVALTPSAKNPGYQNPTSIAELVRRDEWSAARSASINPDEFLTPGSYAAKISDSVFLAPGLEGLKEHRTDCIVLGYFGEAE